MKRVSSPAKLLLVNSFRFFFLFLKTRNFFAYQAQKIAQISFSFASATVVLFQITRKKKEKNEEIECLFSSFYISLFYFQRHKYENILLLCNVLFFEKKKSFRIFSLKLFNLLFICFGGWEGRGEERNETFWVRRDRENAGNILLEMEERRAVKVRKIR